MSDVDCATKRWRDGAYTPEQLLYQIAVMYTGSNRVEESREDQGNNARFSILEGHVERLFLRRLQSHRDVYTAMHLCNN
jgi:hypothetical protein